MFKKERQSEILKIIEETRKVEVEALSRRLNVSEMTIRRDLGELHDRGFLERVHGGALLNPNARINDEPPVIERTKEMVEIKRRIGLAAARMIKDGEKIFLGSGSTTAATAEALLNHRKLTVLTNALNIAYAFLPATEISVVVVGGFLRRSELSLIGHFTENTLQGVHVDKVIIGIRGIDPVKGLTSDHMEELITDQAILNISKHVIVVADHTKIGNIAAIRTAPITTATTIITDTGGPKDVLQVIRKMGVQIIEV